MKFKTALTQFHTREPAYMIATKLKIDIRKIAVIVFRDERRHSLFDRPSKAARLRIGARVVAIVSDRFPTGR
jgi:hypothetical protein